MRLQLLPLIFFVGAGVLLDFYIYKTLRSRYNKKWVAVTHAAISAILTIMIITAMSMPIRSGSEPVLLAVMWMIYTYLSIYIPKALFVIIDLIGRIPQIFGRKRIKALPICGEIIALITFTAMWIGATTNRTSVEIKEVDIEINGLPEPFEGYTIAQFSDAHVGTYGSDTTFASKIVDRINSLKPDAIAFTGDIINRRTLEIDPFVSVLSRLKAPDGVYSILGNHDYGDYCTWSSDEDKKRSFRRLIDLQSQMGWNLLLDDCAIIHRGNDSIAIIGVENIGDPPFPSYGSLENAYPDLTDQTVKILLSHNPTHWSDSICGHHNVNVALTLSGHTHAMQCIVFGWSPAVFRYPRWGGLYRSRTGQQLYVNIGIGTVGLPARIGEATPEITLIKLKKKAKD